MATQAITTMSKITVLVADPDGGVRAETVQTLRDGLSDVTVLEAASLAGAERRLDDGPVEAVVMEYDLGDGTGLDLARHVRSVAPDTGCLLYTDAADIETESVEGVVTEYLRKDAPDAAALLVSLVEQAGPERAQAPYPLPDDEDARLAAVERYVDEGDLREPLDRVVRLAGVHFGVHAASVNIIRERTQDFLVCRGREWETSDRADSICTHTILQGGVMAVEDTHEDPRFADNEFLRSAGIRAYLGATIESPDGHAIATLCVYDDEPRSFPAADREFLADLAGLVGDLLALASRGENA